MFKNQTKIYNMHYGEIAIQSIIFSSNFGLLSALVRGYLMYYYTQRNAQTFGK
jgi:hypothetical protein